MTIEITSAYLKDGVAYIEAIDCSEENLQWIERTRDYDEPREVNFAIDTHSKKNFWYLRNWLKSQKATQGSRNYREALHSICGTVTDLSSRYIAWAD